MTSLRQLCHLLTPRQRRAAIVLFVLMIVGAILEMLGVSLVVPVLAVMTSDDPGGRFPVLRPMLEALGNPGRERLVALALVALVTGAIVKGAFLAVLAWRQMRFVFGVQTELSHRLFEGYLRQPYAFHLQRNSAELINSAMTDTAVLAQTGLASALLGLAELIVVLGISAMLVTVEPTGMLLILVIFGAFSGLSGLLTRRRLMRWGAQRQHHERMRIQHLQQGLGGAKEVKLFGREQEFLDHYRVHNEGSAAVGQIAATLQQLPRLWLEVLTAVAITVLVLVMRRQGRPLETMLPTLGLFAAAAFRVMPSINRVLGTVQNIRYSLPVIGTLNAELQALAAGPPRAAAGPLPLRKRLDVSHVTFRYSPDIAPALRDVSLSIPAGDSVGIIGGSGAGKSTLVDVILGLLSPESGSVSVDGTDIRENLRGWQDQIGYVPQTIFLTDDTLRRNVAFGLPDDRIDDAALQRAVKAARLDHFVADLPEGLDTLVGERGVRLSGGQRQRIGIARALYHDPPTLVLDEATSSLDTATERGVMAAVRALKGEKTLIIVAHRLSTVAHCDWIYRLEHGSVLEHGEPSVVLAEAGRPAEPASVRRATPRLSP